MDSEDEFMSEPPSGDEADFDEGTQDSDIGSLGGGMYAMIHLAPQDTDEESRL
jgi:hypothetical protein